MLPTLTGCTSRPGVVGVRQLIDVGADAAYLFCQFFYFNYAGISDMRVAVDQAGDRRS